MEKTGILVGICGNEEDAGKFIHRICYIRSDRNYCEIHLKDGRMELVRSPICRMEEYLAQKGFFRIHKSYLVNCRWIDKVSEGKVICGEDALPIAVRKMTQFKKWYRRSSLK